MMGTKISFNIDKMRSSWDERLVNVIINAIAIILILITVVQQEFHHHAELLLLKSKYIPQEEDASQNFLTALVPGLPMNSTQFLSNGCDDASSSCAPHFAWLTLDCNLVLVRGSVTSENLEILWQSDPKGKCASGKCQGCEVALDKNTGVLSVTDDKKVRWKSRKPKKVKSVPGDFTATVSDIGRLVLKKGSTTVMNIGHP